MNVISYINGDEHRLPGDVGPPVAGVRALTVVAA